MAAVLVESVLLRNCEIVLTHRNEVGHDSVRIACDMFTVVPDRSWS